MAGVVGVWFAKFGREAAPAAEAEAEVVGRRHQGDPTRRALHQLLHVLAGQRRSRSSWSLPWTLPCSHPHPSRRREPASAGAASGHGCGVGPTAGCGGVCGLSSVQAALLVPGGPSSPLGHGDCSWGMRGCVCGCARHGAPHGRHLLAMLWSRQPRPASPRCPWLSASLPGISGLGDHVAASIPAHLARRHLDG
ncbi:uncharacterized protein LOC125509807 [Triticum urartu]|uniref:uncharacterized protein LOC125509807 n=1 Tax=Triticum urartu TaxID=4572 RepID=UPI0020436A96|nr:uncharacterized protein LOC125509807 [Triticum urartu]